MSDLELLTAVIERRSFSAVARARATTTSAISKRIARLEDDVGVRLLERTTRRVAPTEAGVALYARAVRVLADLDTAAHELADLGGTPRGTLRVSAPVIYGAERLAPVLPGFLARHPDVRVELMLDDRFVDLVAEGVDVALRIGAPPDSSLVQVRVATLRNLVVASPAYLARAGTPQEPADLVRHRCIRYSRMTASREWSFRGRTGAIAIPVTGNLEVNHGGAALAAVVAGAGIARLPDFLVAADVAAGRLQVLLDAYTGEFGSVALVRAGGRSPLPKVRAFVEHMRDALRASARDDRGRPPLSAG